MMWGYGMDSAEKRAKVLKFVAGHIKKSKQKSLKENEFVEKCIALFNEYRENFGLCTECGAQYINNCDEDPSENQCEFEIKFAKLICELKGHNFVPDHCQKPEHDFCVNCNIKRENL